MEVWNYERFTRFGFAWKAPNFHWRIPKEQTIPVKVGSNFSQLYDQEMGVPQGSILSVTLFGLKINSTIKSIAPGVECSLYVDDFLICYRSKYINIIERHIQQLRLAEVTNTTRTQPNSGEGVVMSRCTKICLSIQTSHCDVVTSCVAAVHDCATHKVIIAS